MKIKASTFLRGGHIAPNKKGLVLLKPVMHLSFSYGVLRSLVYHNLAFITSLLSKTNLLLITLM